MLDDLLTQIELHRNQRDRKIVFLGDYIDRGPNSADVVSRLRRMQADEPDRVVCLMGNHEEMLVLSHHSPLFVPDWIRIGGGATLESYEAVDPIEVPSDDIVWLSALPTLYEDERRFFVHAGLKPGRDPHRSSCRIRCWIRKGFIEHDYNFGKHVVHGHTPTSTGQPCTRRYRTNLDTGAVYGRALTAGIFEDQQAAAVGFLRAVP